MPSLIQSKNVHYVMNEKSHNKNEDYNNIHTSHPTLHEISLIFVSHEN